MNIRLEVIHNIGKGIKLLSKIVYIYIATKCFNTIDKKRILSVARNGFEC